MIVEIENIIYNCQELKVEGLLEESRKVLTKELSPLFMDFDDEIIVRHLIREGLSSIGVLK